MMSNKKYRFNMIEISFAILIIAIGVTSIFGLIPVGSKSQSDAMTYSMATDAAETVLSRIASEITEDDGSDTNWNAMIFDGSSFGSIGVDPDDVELPNVAAVKDDSAWTHLDGGKLSSNKSGVYTWDNASNGTVHRFTQFTTLGSTNLRDVDMLARVWQSPIAPIGYNNTGANMMMNNSVLLNIEMSWPIHLGYTERKKLYYQLEVFCSSCDPN